MITLIKSRTIKVLSILCLVALFFNDAQSTSTNDLDLTNEKKETSLGDIPIFITQPTPQFACVGESVSIDVLVAPVPVNMTFNVYQDGILLLAVPDTDSDGAETILLPASSDMLCSTFVIEAINDDDADCASLSDEFTILVHAGDAMVCNDKITLGLDAVCEGEFYTSTFLEGEPLICGLAHEDYYSAFFDAFILTSEGDTLRSGDDLTALIGQCMDFEVHDNCTGNNCWGEICIEDKVAPEIVCETPMCELTSLVSSLDSDDPSFDPDAICWAFDGGSPMPGTLYDVIEFTAPCDGEFTFTMEDNPTIDGIAGIYEGAFDPLNSCDNLIGGDDDIAGVFESEPSFTVTLTEGTIYFLVTSTWGTGQMGIYNWSFDGPCALTTPCVFKCYELDKALTSEVWNELCLPAPEVLECSDYELTYHDSYQYLDPDHVACSPVELTRTWIASQESTHGPLTDTCTQVVLFEPMNLFETFWPDTTVHLPCGHDTSPEAIAAFFDVAITTDAGCDVDVVENNEGYLAAYPYYMAKGCDGELHPQAININVCGLYSSYTDQIIPVCGDNPGCMTNHKVIRTWTILDWCSQDFITFTQVIKSVDTNPPTILVHEFSGGIDPWTCLGNFPLNAPEHIQDDCSHVEEYWVTGPGTITSVNGDGKAPWRVLGAPKGDHIYQYHAEDCCGNVGTVDVLVHVIDDVPPTPILLENLVVSLSGSPFVEQDGVAKIYVEDLDHGSHDGNCGPVRFEVRRVGGAPSCFNEGNNGYNNNVTFNNNLDQNDNNNDTDNGAYVTFCCMDLDSTGVDETTGLQIAYGIHKIIVRVWDSGSDMIPNTSDDNHTDIWMNIRVEDKIPNIVCPPDITICCGWDPDDLSKSGAAFAAGNCEMLDVAVKNDAMLGGFDEVCNEGVIRRTFDVALSRDSITGEVTEWFGAECDQLITVEWESCWNPTWPGGPLEMFDEATGESEYVFKGCVDEEQPYCGDLIDWPNDEEIICATFEHENPTWPAETCDLIGVNLKSDTFFFEEGTSPENPDGACFKVLNHWTLVNYCIEARFDDEAGPDGIFGSDDDISYSTFKHTQVLKFFDDEGPDLKVDTICIAVDNDCEAKKGEAVLVATGCDIAGDCMSDWIKWQAFVDLWSDWTTDYEFSSYVPRFDQNFGTPINELYIPPSSSCVPMEIVLPEDLPASKFEHRVTWKASDGCGNVTSGVSYFTIEDKKAPTPYCVDISTALMSSGALEIWACDMDLGSFDNCTESEDLRFSFGLTDIPDSANPAYDESTNCTSLVLTCDDLENSADGLIPVEIYVWDECDNTDFCRVNINLIDNNDNCDDVLFNRSRMAGVIETELGDDVEAVAVSVQSNQPDYPLSAMSDSDGYWLTDNHLNGVSYAIEAEKDIDYLNGVSTLDIVIIQRHILGISSLNSPYKMIAADVTNDGSITAFDLSELRKLILGVYSELPSNDSWRFADANQVLTATNAFNFNEILSISQLQQHEDFLNFIGIKVGDVNGSVILNATDDSDTRNRESLDLYINNQRAAEGEEIILDFKANNFYEMAGFQFGLSHIGLELVSVTSGLITMTDNNLGTSKDAQTAISWNTSELINAAEDEVLFSLTFKANQKVNTETDVSLISGVTKGEAYTQNLEILDVNLVSNSAAYNLAQNEPNPFVNQTQISFSLPEAAEASITIHDVTGKKLKVISDQCQKGENIITIKKSDLEIRGVAYYTLESGDFKATKKMIIIE